MNKMILKRADGNESGARTSQGGTWWSGLLDNAANIIGSTTGGIASIVAAKEGNYPPAAQVDNTPKILAIAGVGALVLIVVLFIIFKK